MPLSAFSPVASVPGYHRVGTRQGSDFYTCGMMTHSRELSMRSPYASGNSWLTSRIGNSGLTRLPRLTCHFSLCRLVLSAPFLRRSCVFVRLLELRWEEEKGGCWRTTSIGARQNMMDDSSTLLPLDQTATYNIVPVASAESQ